MSNIRENVKINKANYLKNLKSLDLDVVEDIFKRGVLEGTKHSAPSPETISRLEKIEETLSNVITLFTEHSKRESEKIDSFMVEFRDGMKDVKTIIELVGNISFTKKLLIGMGGFLTFAVGGAGGSLGNDNVGASGAANTGNGGTGGNGQVTGAAGGDGGSGVVIVAYTTSDFTFSYSGTSTTGTNGSETWVKMTTSGTLTLTESTSNSTNFFQVL